MKRTNPKPGDTIKLLESDLTGIVLFSMEHIAACMIELNTPRRITKKIISNTDFEITSLPIKNNSMLPIRPAPLY